MKLLKKAMNQTAYLKAGILGFQGSGKTRTACEIGIGLCKLMGKKQAAFFDTETGSDFMIKKFEENGIELYAHKSRSFRDSLAVIREAEEAGVGVLIIDSVTHLWKDLVDSYVKKKKRTKGLYFSDWGIVKPIWQQFSDLYVNSKVNIIICGRAGYEYDTVKNAETGRDELVKGDTKMKAESEFGFEPSLLLEMERISKPGEQKGWINRCTVLKDRTDTMNGSTVDYPTFANFKSVIDFLNIGGEHLGVDTSRNSQDMFRPDGENVSKMRDIALEELKNLCLKVGLGGTAEKVKKQKIELFERIFGTSSWKAIECKDEIDLRSGMAKIEVEFGLREIPKGQDDTAGM